MVASISNPYDIFSPLSERNHILHEQMRIEDPIHCAIHPQTGHRYWFLTRYDHCLQFLKDKRFGKESRKHLPAQLSNQWVADDTADIINRHMLNLDDPAHERLKSLVHFDFTPLRISSLRPHLQTIADSLFDAIETSVVDGDEFDLTERYIKQFPLLSIVEILGIPLEDYQDLYLWTQGMLDPDPTVVHATIDHFSVYLHKQIDIRRENPDTYKDLLSRLVFAEDKRDQLQRDELLAMVYLFITAGYETMVNFLNNSIMSLFEHPDQLRLLQDHINNPAIVKTAIDEMLRYNGPSHMTLASWAFHDVEIGGKVIKQGDIVHAVLHAANRDPEVFDNPHKFDILRQPNKHIAFSYGIHHCLGAALARLEGDIAVSTLIRRMPNL